MLHPGVARHKRELAAATVDSATVLCNARPARSAAPRSACPVLRPPLPLHPPTPAPLTNWAGNYTYHAERLHRPATVEAVQAIVARAERVKVLGTRHSFNGIADTAGDLVSLERLAGVVALDPDARTVTVEGGISYGALAEHLAGAGWALHNLASLPHISVAGACATGTHGSGDANANLASAVRAMELVTAGGDVVALARDRDGDRFRGAVVHLGALGVVTRLTLDVRPAFEVVQHVYEDVPLAELDAHLDEVMGSAYSVSVFTRWRCPRVDQVWLKRVHAPGAPAGPPRGLLGAAPAADHRHPIAGISAAHCTEQLGVPGPWHDRLPHFRMNFTPSSGAELQSDYLVPRAHAREALRLVDAMRDRVSPLVLVSELRTVAADDLWMSPAYGRDCLSVHFTWVPDRAAVRALLPELEARLVPLGARPHWGKLFAVPAAGVAAAYERLPDFRALARALDPAGKFRNAFLDAHVLG